ncbi:MAG: hypothetical protein ACO3A2_04985 [Bdellovibrionia bacterium]
MIKKRTSQLALVRTSVLLLLFLGLSGCLGLGDSPSSTGLEPADQASCAPKRLPSGLGSVGLAQVFNPDPIVRSGNRGLTPRVGPLDQLLQTVELAHLRGNGVLSGSYIQVLNGLKCQEKYGAYDPANQFIYSHRDWRFGEAMTYYFGDSYQSFLDSIGYLQPSGATGGRSRSSAGGPVQIIAHCELNDNAYFIRGMDSRGNPVKRVCLGDSVRTPGAFYGDDAVVTLHELQHATTSEQYSSEHDLSQLFYDEAGALNEAISDVMSLIFTAPQVSSRNLDPRVFSRWALGTFDPKSSHVRGAHLCPVYDSRYPSCDGFPGFSLPRQENGYQTTISYVYPDGLGWPYPANVKGSQAAQKIFLGYPSQEEIHNAGMVMLGALWDVYSAVLSGHSEDEASAKKMVSQLILESLRHLPKPNTTTNHSPVTFLLFAQNLVNYAPWISGLNSVDQSRIQAALRARGLFDAPFVDREDWLGLGSGATVGGSTALTPGVYIEDNPEVLSGWLDQLGVDSQAVFRRFTPQVNHTLNPGEIATLWFDLQNQADPTVGGVLVTVSSLDPDLEILDQRINVGYMTRSGLNQTQVMYEKINGNSIVTALGSGLGRSSIPIGNSYFKTNPFFNRSLRTAVWVKVAEGASHGKTVELEIEAAPSNAVASKRTVELTIE